jgi:sulfatase modifying factor 1
MDTIIEELSKQIPFGKLFLKIGLSAKLSALLSLILTCAIVYLGIYIIKKIYSYYKTCKASQDLAPYFDHNKVKMSIKYFIPTKGQNFSPTHEEEPSTSSKYIVNKKLIPWFIDEVFKGEKEGDKFYLVLADSGMGKSTFMINLFMKYNSFFNFNHKYKIKLIPFGDERIIDQLKKIAKNQDEAKNTILLLDAFDEYKGLLSPETPDDLSDEDRFKMRLDEIFEIVRDFRDVIITSRTQYFPGQEDQPYELKVPRFDDNGYHKLSKLYLSPFNKKEIKIYLNKKYGVIKFWNIKKKKIATNIVTNSHKLMVRPMLLSYINYLVDDNIKFENTYDIYNTLIVKWIEREANKRKYETNSRIKFKEDLSKFSILVAIEIYKSRKHSLLSVKKEMATNICNANNINLKGFEITGQSLLTKDATSNWKFAHKSIYEFYIAKYAIENISFGFNLDVTGMDMTEKFIIENNLKSIFLFNYSLYWRNETFIEKRNERRKQFIEETSFIKSYYISRFLVTNNDYLKIAGEDLSKKQENSIVAPSRTILTKYLYDYMFQNSHNTRTLSKDQAINYCNKLNNILGFKIQYNEFGKLVDENGKKIRNITDIKGFRLPTINEIELFLEKEDNHYKELKKLDEEEKKIVRINTIQINESQMIKNFEWSHEEIGSNDVDNSLWTSIQKKDKLVVKTKHRRLFMRLVYMN